jgi:hypothetical protein
MPKQTKAEKLADVRINRAYYATCARIPINVFDIGKIFEHGRRQIAMHNVDDAALAISIREYVETIRTD